VDACVVAPSGEWFVGRNRAGAVIRGTRGGGRSIENDKSPPTDTLQVGSVWVGGDLNHKLTITERKGENFRGRFTASVFDREVTGIVKEGRISWNAKDVTASKGGPGGDNVGVARGERIDFTWRDGGNTGKFSLRLQKSQ